ncbi:MAG: hypothetical protein JXA57_00730 [Armatimonadetes bacterium]|nr:hypothetical protein [Armatimonadota bacterium]
MRHFATVTAVTCALILAVGMAAAERPLAALVPDDVSSYQEIHLDRVLGRAPETATLGQVLRQMQSPRLFQEMFVQFTGEESEAKEVAEVFELLQVADKAIGPRVGFAMWAPDAEAMIAGAAGGGAASPLSMMPKMLVVAEVRDAQAVDALLTRLVEEMEVPARTEARGDVSVTSFAQGMVELARGDDWLALSFPPEPAKRAVDLVTGRTTGSLYANPDYLKVTNRLPVDAMMVTYSSADSVRQLISAANTVVPDAQFNYPRDEPLGIALGARVEEVQGKKMLTVYYTADLDLIPYVFDPSVAFQMTLMKPIFDRSREEARATVCENNLWVIGEAFYAYAYDHDGRLPDAETWAEALWPYLEDEGALKCPSDDSEAETSYVMNPAASGRVLEEIEEPESFILLYEPARHAGEANCLYADGIVERVEGEPDLSQE